MGSIEEQRASIDLLRFALDRVGVGGARFQIEPDRELGVDELGYDGAADGARASGDDVLCLLPRRDGPWTVLYRDGDGVRGRAVHDESHDAIRDFYWRLVRRDRLWDYCDDWNASGRDQRPLRSLVGFEPSDGDEADTISLLEFAIGQHSASHLAFQIGREGDAIGLYEGHCLFKQGDGRWATFFWDRGNIEARTTFDEVGDAALYSYWQMTDRDNPRTGTPWEFCPQWRAQPGAEA